MQRGGVLEKVMIVERYLRMAFADLGIPQIPITIAQNNQLTPWLNRYGERHARRKFKQHLGASPKEFANMHRKMPTATLC